MAEGTGLELRSLVTSDGRLELSLVPVPTGTPGPDEVVVRVQAAPINPSDLGLLLSAADASAATVEGAGADAVATAPVPTASLKALKPRLGQSLPVGNEGAGVVVQAGASPQAQALVDKTVAIWSGATYAQFRKVRAADCLVLPNGATAKDGASAFVNPLTALGMVETMRREGHKGLVHTAAASNLGQMLVRLCKSEGAPLVNIVRNSRQVALLKDLGAEHVVDSSELNFRDELTAALKATGATLGFDAIGGGKLAGQILGAMEAVASASAPYSRYGSSVYKQVYVYGGLDPAPIEVARNVGMNWGLGGWLLNHFLAKAGPETEAHLKAKVAAEIKTTFASHYTRTISLAEALDPKVIADYARKATSEKFLIDPSLPLA
ncbi:MAG: zinc-binding dehydrogenase [Caulobacteraceae bacterium]